MPRIRSIRPEFWTRRKLSAAPPAVRLVMLGLIQLADDEGRLEGDLVILRSLLFPAGGIEQVEFDGAVRQLAAFGEITIYEVDGAPFVCLPGWKDRKSWQFQQISKPQASRLPQAPSGNAPVMLPEPSGSVPAPIQEPSRTAPVRLPEHSGNVPGVLPEPSGSVPGGSGSGVEEEERPPLPPAAAGGGGDSPSAFTPGERAAAEVIASAIERGDVKLEPDDDQRAVDRDLTGADAAKRDATRARDANALAAAERRIEELTRRRRELAEQRRAEAIVQLRSGSVEAVRLLERYQISDQLVGTKGHQVPLRVACAAAKKQVRGDERDRRRITKSLKQVEFDVRAISVDRSDPRKSRAVELLAKPRDDAWMRAAQDLIERPVRQQVGAA